MTYEYDKLEPIGLFFVFWFISILVIQLIGMLMHRITTLGHIVSSTSLKKNFRHHSHVISAIVRQGFDKGAVHK